MYRRLNAMFPNGSPEFWQVQTARAKTGKGVLCTIRREDAEKILAGALPTGEFLFVESVPQGERATDTFIKMWGDPISKLGELANIRDENDEQLFPTSHWMRHSFVAWCFKNGISTEEVAELIGDTVVTVAHHYSGWFHARQDVLTEKMKKALAAKADEGVDCEVREELEQLERRMNAEATRIIERARAAKKAQAATVGN